jgi:hypothetical protein
MEAPLKYPPNRSDFFSTETPFLRPCSNWWFLGAPGLIRTVFRPSVRHYTPLQQTVTYRHQQLQRLSLYHLPPIARDSTLSQKTKLTLYKLLILSILTYAAPVWISTCDSNYLKLQDDQNKSLRVISKYPRGALISQLYDILNIEPIQEFIHRLRVKLFAHCPSHPNSMVQQIGNYTLYGLNSMCKNIDIKGRNTFCCNQLITRYNVFFTTFIYLYLYLPLFNVLTVIQIGYRKTFVSFFVNTVNIFLEINNVKKHFLFLHTFFWRRIHKQPTKHYV